MLDTCEHEDIFTLHRLLCQYSVIGSLGVSDGFQTLVNSHTEILKEQRYLGIWDSSRGENLSLIMVESGKGENKGRYIIENRIYALIDEFNIDKNRMGGILQVSYMEYQGTVRVALRDNQALLSAQMKEV